MRDSVENSLILISKLKNKIQLNKIKSNNKFHSTYENLSKLLCNFNKRNLISRFQKIKYLQY